MRRNHARISRSILDKHQKHANRFLHLLPRQRASITNTTKRYRITYTQREGSPERQTYQLETNHPSQHRLQNPSKNHSIEIEPIHQYTHSWGSMPVHQRPQPLSYKRGESLAPRATEPSAARSWTPPPRHVFIATEPTGPAVLPRVTKCGSVVNANRGLTSLFWGHENRYRTVFD